MNLESPKVKISKTQQEVFNFLADVKNFEKIMPESIEKFESLDQDSFLFQLKGMPVLKLTLKEKIVASKIVLGAKSDKLPFKLTADIQEIDENSSEIQLLFEGEFNAMMSMMIKSPIQKFITSLSENLKKLFN
jgi:carbon monoxide dehydrogenase subunit G